MLASVAVACGPWSWGSVVVLHRLRCSGAGGILPDRGLNLCPLRWRADNYPLGESSLVYWLFDRGDFFPFSVSVIGSNGVVQDSFLPVLLGDSHLTHAHSQLLTGPPPQHVIPWGQSESPWRGRSPSAKEALRVPWTARRSNQSILKEIRPEYSLEGLMLKLMLQYFKATWCEELTHLKRPWCWERLGQGEKGTTEDEMVGWHHWLNGYEFEQAPGVGEGQGGLACCSPWGCKESEAIEQLNWTEGNLVGWVSTEGTAWLQKGRVDTWCGVGGPRDWDPAGWDLG